MGEGGREAGEESQSIPIPSGATDIPSGDASDWWPIYWDLQEGCFVTI